MYVEEMPCTHCGHVFRALSATRHERAATVIYVKELRRSHMVEHDARLRVAHQRSLIALRLEAEGL